MIDLIMIILFGREILLTPDYVSLTNEYLELQPKKEISAINAGATLNVQLSPISSIIEQVKSAEDPIEELEKRLTQGTIEAILIDTNGDEVFLESSGILVSDFTLTKDGCVRISLARNVGNLLERKFKALKIKSKIPISNTKIVWRNHSK